MTAPASLAEALAALQAQMPPVGKHSKGKVSGTSKAGNKYEYDYSYAPGEDITPKLYPLMGALGLSYTAAPTMHEGRFVLEYELLHVSGESRGPYWYPLPDPDRYGPQDLGKAETYARRYALTAVTGLFPGGDDTDAGEVQAQHEDKRLPRAVSSQEKQRAKTDRVRAGTRRGARKLDPDNDPWAQDAPVDGPRAAAMRETLSGPDLTDPEDKPGSANDGQKRAIERLMGEHMLNVGNDRDKRHRYAADILKLPQLDSMNDLSLSQAADVIRALQADYNVMREARDA